MSSAILPSGYQVSLGHLGSGLLQPCRGLARRRCLGRAGHAHHHHLHAWCAGDEDSSHLPAVPERADVVLLVPNQVYVERAAGLVLDTELSDD